MKVPQVEVLIVADEPLGSLMVDQLARSSKKSSQTAERHHHLRPSGIGVTFVALVLRSSFAQSRSI